MFGKFPFGRSKQAKAEPEKKEDVKVEKDLPSETKENTPNKENTEPEVKEEPTEKEEPKGLFLHKTKNIGDLVCNYFTHRRRYNVNLLNFHIKEVLMFFFNLVNTDILI